MTTDEPLDRAAAEPEQPGSPTGGPARPRRRLRSRLLLALTAFALTCLLVEGVARVALPSVALVQLRDGIYLSTLPLVNGRPDLRGSDQERRGERLPVAKRPGEIRVFTFGESSMEGCPWGHEASPATMLHDILAARLPDHRVTVVNMGRTSSFMMDTYYYELAARPYEPDFLVFYQGNNDRFDLDPEMCWPQTHPLLHRLWRFLVRHSRLLWTVRALGPEAMGPLRASSDMHLDHGAMCEEGAFGRWADVVLDEAEAMGARAVVASPVRSVLDDLAYSTGGPSDEVTTAEAIGRVEGDARTFLVCLLTPRCDLAARVLEAGVAPEPALIVARGEAWRESAQRHGAIFVDFRRVLAERAPGHVLGPPLVVDECHLDFEGYGLLAAALAREIEQGVTGQELEPAGWLDVSRYRRDAVDGRRMLRQTGAWKLSARTFVIAAAILAPLAEAHPDGPEALLVGQMRLALGLPLLLGPEAEALARRWDLDAVIDLAREPLSARELLERLSERGPDDR